MELPSPRKLGGALIFNETWSGAAVAGETPIRIVERDGFSWADAGIGAGAAFGTVLVLGGARRAVRNHLVPARP